MAMLRIGSSEIITMSKSCGFAAQLAAAVVRILIRRTGSSGRSTNETAAQRKWRLFGL
ncbi:hypothetical protein [Paenibacillus sp. 2TAB26]|uniref:hypothetical protein n=1 Tax=Paenibacillus sp. 2TAB26 TaxID=3233005 RepID=UPI003F957F34